MDVHTFNYPACDFSECPDTSVCVNSCSLNLTADCASSVQVQLLIELLALQFKKSQLAYLEFELASLKLQ